MLPLDPHPAVRAGGSRDAGFVEHQTFELVSERSRALLGRTGRKVQTDLNQVYAALGDFLADRCPSARELLHPGMN